MGLPNENPYVIKDTDYVIGDTTGTELSGAIQVANVPHKHLQENIDYIHNNEQPIRDISRNLIITNNATNPEKQMDIDADEVILHNSSSEALRVSSVNLTVDVTVSGVNGLDSGSESNVWYYLYVITNGTTIAGLLSESSTSPTMPSGYEYKALVGAIYNSSGDFINIYQQGNRVGRERIEVLTNGSEGTPTSISLSSIVPPSATKISGDLHQTTSGTQNAYVGYYDIVRTIWNYLHVWHKSGAMSNHNSGGFECFMRNSEIFYYVSNGNVDLNITGWEYSN